MRRPLPAVIALAAAFAAGCGSGDGLAPRAEPARSPPLAVKPAGSVVPLGTGRRSRTATVAVTASGEHIAVLDSRRRTLELLDAHSRRSLGRIPVGIGPTHVVARGERLFVVDTRGNGLIEVHADPLRVHRRTHLEGTPYGIVFDGARKRFWVALTATNQLAELTDRRLVRTFPSVRQPSAVVLDPENGDVLVSSGRTRLMQRLDPSPYER